MMRPVKKHRHMRLLGSVDGNHTNKIPRQFRGNSLWKQLKLRGMKEKFIEQLLLGAQQSLNGDTTLLCKLLTTKQRDKLFSFLNNNKGE